MDRAETKAFNEDFLPNFNGWHSRVEYASGGTPGFADALLLVDGKFLPLEVKVGERLNNGEVRVSVRPSQVLWHRSIERAGGVSAFFVKVRDLFWLVAGKDQDLVRRDLSRLGSCILRESSIMGNLRAIIDPRLVRKRIAA